MWGHLIKLESPDKYSQVAFFITSTRKMHSISVCMAETDALRGFRDWNLLEFRVQASTPEGRPEGPTSPGSLIDCAV